MCSTPNAAWKYFSQLLGNISGSSKEIFLVARRKYFFQCSMEIFRVAGHIISFAGRYMFCMELRNFRMNRWTFQLKVISCIKYSRNYNIIFMKHNLPCSLPKIKKTGQRTFEVSRIQMGLLFAAVFNVSARQPMSVGLTTIFHSQL